MFRCRTALASLGSHAGFSSDAACTSITMPSSAATLQEAKLEAAKRSEDAEAARAQALSQLALLQQQIQDLQNKQEQDEAALKVGSRHSGQLCWS